MQDFEPPSNRDSNLVATTIEQLYRESSRKVFASLARCLSDLDLAEDALQDAFTQAATQWQTEGIPQNPISWLISTGRFKAIDRIRRDAKIGQNASVISDRISRIASMNAARSDQAIEDDRLRLIFTCCHPAIDRMVQVPLTLREVCGLTTEEIASAFLTTPTAMSQRIVRGKSKIRNANIPITIPELSELPSRLDVVLSVVYLIFNEGYCASSGDSLTRSDLSAEAIRLGRLLVDLSPDPEVKGLLALMLLHESRRKARSDSEGNLVLLEDQDRTQWDGALIAEGVALVEDSIASRRVGGYTIQAAISAVHSHAKFAAETDWRQIVALYDVLMLLEASPVVELNRAVAVAMRDEPLAGAELIEAIHQRGELKEYAPSYSAVAELLRRGGKRKRALSAFERALELTTQQSERRFLMQRIAELRNHQ
ncbi:RNA polymerase sigma factor [Rhodopirellula sp. MGV]|uniref:RNA polymerase sigma factor n=1 Tax=Rhodopirellula sp. MGV TaxID=2023130 RepID=UPI000B974A7D|nr:RNA polymerase sigma factor [Rhodopirellula sp. MGV]OYP32243.1 RNA polymerase subunit sigma-24 [Rhodopirellula sp. MGV]PNY35975.1 RNA polymerase subunit sigma-24 [Rhodopirellula baltica]